ncbi:MAG: hypothetical protein JO317_03085, partial [Verrucomicrobiae bacterium]|nr:hypothetical protein [Verrucomicrobiae bacterium]
MTPEDFCEELKTALAGRGELVSVILYGSAAAGDHAGDGSDFNLIVVLGTLELQTLERLAPAVRAWVRAGNPPPLLFTPGSFTRSIDAFPIEMSDLRQSRKLLHGEDVAAKLEISREVLRLQLEHELRGKLLQLRSHYLLAREKPRQVAELMLKSYSNFAALFRAAFRLRQEAAPAKRLEVVEALARELGFSAEPFR